MPKVVKEMPEVSRMSAGESKYDKYMDGQVWQFTPKELPTKKLSSLRATLYRIAKAKHLTVTVRMKEGNTFVQALPKTPE
jgi:hypothetical protein